MAFTKKSQSENLMENKNVQMADGSINTTATAMMAPQTTDMENQAAVS